MSLHRHLTIAFALTAVLNLICISASAEQVIRYPQSGESFDDHRAYPLALLTLALKKSEQNVSLRPSKTLMTQGRAIKELETGKKIDVMWTMTSKEREAAAQPVRIPIYKGLIGWRVFLMPTANELDAADAIPLDQLKKIAMIQGHDWPDTKILKQNGFNVQSSPTYDGIFKMLALGRADLFPRSVIEVWDELNKHKEKNIRLEQHTIIRYPTASYFFTSKQNEALAEQIRSGLQAAIDDGSFDRLFEYYYNDFILKAKVASRVHYTLDNPLLPAETPLDNSRLWFQ